MEEKEREEMETKVDAGEIERQRWETHTRRETGFGGQVENIEGITVKSLQQR